MNFVRALAALALVSPLLAQYGGPAILARGQAPTAMAPNQIDFRPFVSVSGIYHSGLNGVSVDAAGLPINDASAGVQVGFGVSGSHSWKRTRVGLNFAGGLSHYNQQFYDGLNSMTLQLSITHQLSRHAMLAFNNSAVLYGSNRATATLPPTIEFDPATTFLPTNDFFDNRTFSISTQASLTMQRSTRLSYSVALDAFLTRRRSTALFGSTGAGGFGDIQYRVSRRATVGGMYNYMHYSFTGIAGSTDLHTVAGTYSRILSASTQFSAMGGFSRYENLFVHIVPIDPAIAAVIGINFAQRVNYVRNVTPSMGARITHRVPKGSLVLNASRFINPGNGLFLTSVATTVSGGYNYTGLRRWSLSASGGYNNSTSAGNFVGQYGDISSTLTASRQVARMTHAVGNFYVRKYTSGDFTNYNKWAWGAALGLSFTPGDIPVRLW